MKFAYFLSIILFLNIRVFSAQSGLVTIPDPNFATYLQGIIPTAISGNQLDTTNINAKTLSYINASGLNIADLTGVQYFRSLKQLQCPNNLLTSLPPLPDSLLVLTCNNNKLISLPPLPKMLQSLWCGNNFLISIPVLPYTLLQLLCDGNALTNLPTLPNSLQTLTCGNNAITILPVLPSSLKSLNCEKNKLTSLPELPDSLISLVCINNEITCFPTFPNSLTSLIIFNNSFNCLPNYVRCMSALQINGIILNTYPLCNVDNTNGCPISTDAPTQIIIPNIFTPNGDNINDEFLIKGSNLNNFICKIYDRWGTLIYQWSDINSGWNSKNKSGVVCNDGTYYYVVSYTDNKGTATNKNGFFELVR